MRTAFRIPILALAPVLGLGLSCLIVAAACHREPPAPAATPATAQPAAGSTAQAELVASPPAEAAESAPAGSTSPLPEPDLGYNARQGRVLFQHYCATCHGPEGRGDGFNSYNLDPGPRDLSDPAFQAQRSDDDLASIIRIGGGAAGLSTGMPPWGHTLNERQIHDLVLYVRTFKPEPSTE
jgi:mono/diheme cytochrome c family protein